MSSFKDLSLKDLLDRYQIEAWDNHLGLVHVHVVLPGYPFLYLKSYSLAYFRRVCRKCGHNPSHLIVNKPY